MSDFDKEAERERLREKYESDEEDREATQRMSELLLKGATMTNSHCGSCGDPIFRYDGTEFCPTCNAGEEAGVANADEGAGVANADEGTDAADVNDGGATAESDADASGRADATDEATPRPANASSTAGAPVDAARRDPPSQPGATRGRDDHARVRDTAPGRSADGTAAGRDSAARAEGASDSRAPVAVDADAVANVEATLQRFAAAANETTDPERARDCLRVVRDAADTLRALRADGR